jgi:hypothetical protein
VLFPVVIEEPLKHAVCHGLVYCKALFPVVIEGAFETRCMTSCCLLQGSVSCPDRGGPLKHAVCHGLVYCEALFPVLIEGDFETRGVTWSCLLQGAVSCPDRGGLLKHAV